MKRAAIYIRTALAEQPVHMLVEALKEHAKAKGWKVTHCYHDDGVSGLASGPSLQAMIADAEAQKFDIILIQDLNRLSRNTQKLAELILKFKKLGIEVQTPFLPGGATLLAALTQTELHDPLQTSGK